jgi:hypothetical protein
MAKQEFKPMSWLVKRYDINSNSIVDCNVLKYFEKNIKQFKKQCNTKNAFADVVRRELMWRYWSKSEHELIVEIDSNRRVWLKPWSGCRDPEKVRIDVTEDQAFNWRSFAEACISEQIFGTSAKIDIYDQLWFQWSAFIDYCWNYRHKWQRNKNIT